MSDRAGAGDARAMTSAQFAEALRTHAWRRPQNAPPAPPPPPQKRVMDMTDAEFATALKRGAWRS